MRKVVIFAVFFILVAGAAFAQLASGIWVNAWGRGAFVPLWYETPETVYGTPRPNSEGLFKNGTGVTWDPNNQSRVDFRVNAATDYVGFTIHVNSEYLSGTGNGDNGAQLWVKPFGNNWLKLTVANHFIEDALRGRVTTDTGFENFVLGKSMMKFTDGLEPLNQDVLFNRFAGGRGSVAAANASNTSTHISQDAVLSNVFFLSSSPIEGLFVGLMLQGIFPDTDLKETWRQMQLGAGYEIPGVGFARAQYIGGFMGKEKDLNDGFRLTEPSKFEAAFALTSVENLMLDVGFKIWMPVTSADNRAIANRTITSYRGLDVALGASYRLDNLNIAFMGQALYLGAYTGALTHSPTKGEKGADGIRLVFNLIPEYDFDFGTVGLSFIAQTKTADTRVDGTKAERYADGGPWTRFGAGAWYKKGLPGGYIKVGVAYAFPYIAFGTPAITTVEVIPEDKTAFNGRGILTIPIILEYAFF